MLTVKEQSAFNGLEMAQAVTGATQSTYTLVAGDNGKGISVKASYTDGLNELESVTSAAMNAAYWTNPSHR
jgi:hypothetical protein